MKLVVVGLLVIHGLTVISAVTVKLKLHKANCPKNGPCHLTCTLSQAESIKDNIYFYKGNQQIAVIFQNKAACANYYVPKSGYSTFCSNGTNSYRSPVKQYVLKIQRMSSSDIKKWTCIFGRRKKIRSNTVEPNMQGISLTMSASQTVVEIKNKSRPIPGLNCSVSNAAYINDEIIFYKDKVFFASFKQERGMCRPFFYASKRFMMQCGNNTASSYVKSYSIFNLELRKVDAAYWTCELYQLEKKSNRLSVGVSDNTPPGRPRREHTKGKSSIRDAHGQALKSSDKVNVYSTASLSVFGIFELITIVVLVILIRQKQRMASSDKTQVVDQKAGTADKGITNPSYILDEH